MQAARLKRSGALVTGQPRPREFGFAEMGRKTLYKPEYAEQIKKLCLLNLTEERICEFYGISTATMDKWKRANPDLVTALNEGKLVADGEVACRLLKRALGYEYVAEKPIANQKTEEGYVVARYTEHIPPDVGAIKIWLSNRHGRLWKNGDSLLDAALGEDVKRITLEVERGDAPESQNP